MLLLISLLLALLPLLGIIGIAAYSSLLTVDGLFTSLILLAISATFGGSALAELRRWRSGASAKTGRPTARMMASAAGLIQRGKVESVQFFEAHVGQPNKSIVTPLCGVSSLLKPCWCLRATCETLCRPAKLWR